MLTNSLQTNSLQGVLIAGVQAQGLASTYTLHDTKLQAVTNASGFIGLILDIIGALFGVVNAILLQKSISMYQKLLLSQPSRTNQRKQQLRDLMTLVTSDGPAAVAGRARIIKQLQGEIRRSKSELRPHAPNWKARISLLFRLVQDHRLILLCIIPLLILVVEVFIFVAEAFWDRGQLPVALMSLGIACFLIFVLCFATSSQPEPIWIACIAVTTLGVVYSSYVMYVNRPMRSESIPLSLPLPGINARCLSDDEKEEFFRNLSAPSEQLPGSPVDRPRREHVTIF